MFRGHFPPSNHNTAPDPSGQPHAPSGGGIYRMPPVASGYAPGTRFGSAQSSLHQPQMQDYSYNSNSPHRMYYESEYPLPSNGNEYGQYGQHLAYAAEDQYHAHDGMMPLGDSNPVFEMTQDFPDLASKQDFPALGETVQEPRRNDIKPIEISRQYSSQSRTNSNSRWRHDASSDEFPPIEQSGKVGYSPAVIGKRFNAESMNSNPLNNKSNYPSKSNQPLSLSPDPRATPVNNIQNAPLSTAVANLRIEDTSSSDGRVLESQDTSVYGLKGLLKIIRMADPDLNTLALGTDLTTLGLDLNSTEYLSFYRKHPKVVSLIDLFLVFCILLLLRRFLTLQ